MGAIPVLQKQKILQVRLRYQLHLTLSSATLYTNNQYDVSITANLNPVTTEGGFICGYMGDNAYSGASETISEFRITVAFINPTYTQLFMSLHVILSIPIFCQCYNFLCKLF